MVPTKIEGPTNAPLSIVAPDEPGEPPGTIRIQPMPTSCTVLDILDSEYSVVTRRFPEGQASRCGLCPRGRCVAVEDVCTLAFPWKVTDAEAPLISSVGRARDH